MRRSIREFAAMLGIETTTINNWRSGLSSVTPRTKIQAILDTTYQQRATAEDRARFEQIVAEGEAAWCVRHRRMPPAAAMTHTGDDRSDDDGGGLTNRREALRMLGVGGLAAGASVRNPVLVAARESALIGDSMAPPTIATDALRDAAEDLYQLASDYALAPDLPRLFVQLVTVRDQLAASLRHAGRITDLRELYALFAATCALLASVSHDLAEPKAAMMQTRVAGRFAELAGHRPLHAWVVCTRAMIASWWSSPEQVIREAGRAQHVSGIAGVRLAGLRARAHAQLGDHAAAVDAVHTAHREREKITEPDGLTDFGPIFGFSRARQHYYDASTYAYLRDWNSVERNAGVVTELSRPSPATAWPVTLMLTQVNLAHARWNTDGSVAAFEALRPVLALPSDQRIPQVLSAVRTADISMRNDPIRSKDTALLDAIDQFTSPEGALA
ncbi:hypothetical protein AB0H71_19445 [Nocardia sp. NPDC050697]|uniref:hypothetical protein n=1 Tax=Nocardia sp. NPDC050697 TaxID=3155158 RepID=UPI0033C957F4